LLTSLYNNCVLQRKEERVLLGFKGLLYIGVLAIHTEAESRDSLFREAGEFLVLAVAGGHL
jgi:hypothetical protein